MPPTGLETDRARNHETQRKATGAAAAQTPQTPRLASVVGGAPKRSRQTNPSFHPAGPPIPREHRQIVQKDGFVQGFESSIAIAVPCVRLFGYFRPPKTVKVVASSSVPSKIIRRWRRAALDDACRCSHRWLADGHTNNRHMERKHEFVQYFDASIAVIVPCVTFRATSSHPRDP